jgi:hypothetical protein
VCYSSANISFNTSIFKLLDLEPKNIAFQNNK